MKEYFPFECLLSQGVRRQNVKIVLFMLATVQIYSSVSQMLTEDLLFQFAVLPGPCIF